MSDNATNMRQLMESINPVKEMDDMSVDNMGAMDNNGSPEEYAPDMGGEPEMGADMGGEMPMDMGAEMGGEPEMGVSTDIIDALEGEFKRLTTEFLQTGGEMDEAGLSDVREKLGKHMTSILDVLHSGWMDNMMDQAGGAEGDDSEGDSDSPFGGDADDESAEHEASETDAEEKEEQEDGDDDDKEEKSDDSDSDDKEEEKDDDDGDDKDDSGEKGEEFNFDEAHLNESPAAAFRKLQDRMLKEG